MQGLRSVLFVDFDNIFRGLMLLDRVAGLSFAQEPGRWLERLSTHGLAGSGQRRFLQRRAYLNPAGWIEDSELGNQSSRLYLQRFRPNLTRAGFEVIDCPALTQRHKNAADIRIVIDVLTSLDSGSPFDEFVIASSDADFTPLLHRLRSRDRRIMVMAAGQASPAYHSVADDLIGPEALIAMLRQPAEPMTSVRVDDVGQLRGSGPSPGPAAPDSDQALAVHYVLDCLASSDVPLFLSHIGHQLRVTLGDAIDTTSWFGHGGLTAFLRSIEGGRLGLNSSFAWDPDRHDEPDDPVGDSQRVDLPPLIRDIRIVTELPPLTAEAWPPLFAALASYGATEDFNLTACTSTVRDMLKDTDTPVARSVVGFVVRGVSFGGVHLYDRPSPSPDVLRDAFKAAMVDRYESAGFALEEEQLVELDNWLRGHESAAGA
jgi:hypothetical protein